MREAGAALVNWAPNPDARTVVVMAVHLIVVESETTLKAFALKHLGEPELVVLPHLVVGHLVGLHPHGKGFVRFGQLSLVEVTDEDRAVNAQAVGELEVKFAMVLEIGWRESDFFLSLTNRGFLNGLPLVDLAARAVDLALAKTAFLPYK